MNRTLPRIIIEAFCAFAAWILIDILLTVGLPYLSIIKF